MTTKIDGSEFARQIGVIRPYTKPTVTFSSPVSPGVGAQVFGEQGESFEIELTQFAGGSQRDILEAFARSKEGKIVAIESDGRIYALPQYGGYRFFVERVSVASSEIIPRVCGYRSSGSYDYSPAAKVVTTWKLHAVK